MLLRGDPAGHLRVLHVGGYWRGPNDVVRMMMNGLARTGAEVVELDTDARPEALDTDGRAYDRGTFGPVWLRAEATAPLIADLDPHLIVCNAGGLSFRPDEAARLRKRRCLLGVALSDPDVFEPTTRWIAGHFDRFLTVSEECLPRYRELGVEAALLRLGTDERFYRPAPQRRELACEVAIIGRAHPDRVPAARALASRFEVHLYGEGWEEHGLASRGFLFGEDLLALLNSAELTVVFDGTAGGYRLPKVQVLDFVAAGAIVLASANPGLALYLRFDEELLVFRETEELVGLVTRCLADPEWAQRIRTAGRRRVLAEHTWRHRWMEILESLGAGAGDLARRGGGR